MTAPTIQDKFAMIRKELAAFLIERDAEVDVVLTALIAQENPLLVGPPGTAKSLLLDSLMDMMHGRKFSVLFNKFTTPEEVYGPISVKGLKEDVYRRCTFGMLPEAHGAFGDEIFKASSAILNTLLRILNERTYEGRRVPLRIFVAASNEWPQSENGGKELAALFDRFLFRRTVRPVMTAAGKERLRWSHRAEFRTMYTSKQITPEEVDQAHAEAGALPWSDEAKAAFDQVLGQLNKEGIFPGDRRQYKAVGAARAFAYLCGAAEVAPDHLEILTSVLWDDPEQTPKCEAIIAKIANPSSMKINSVLWEVEGILNGLDAKDLKAAATASKKLQECAKQLGALHGSERAAKAALYVKGEIKRIHQMSMESL